MCGCAIGRLVLQRCASVTACVCAGGTPCGTSAGARARSAQRRCRRCWSHPSATAADRLFARCSLAVGALSSPLSPVRCAWLSRRLWRRRSGSTTSYWLPLVPCGQLCAVTPHEPAGASLIGALARALARSPVVRLRLTSELRAGSWEARLSETRQEPGDSSLKIRHIIQDTWRRWPYHASVEILAAKTTPSSPAGLLVLVLCRRELFRPHPTCCMLAATCSS